MNIMFIVWFFLCVLLYTIKVASQKMYMAALYESLLELQATFFFFLRFSRFVTNEFPTIM